MSRDDFPEGGHLNRCLYSHHVSQKTVDVQSESNSNKTCSICVNLVSFAECFGLILLWIAGRACIPLHIYTTQRNIFRIQEIQRGHEIQRQYVCP